MVTRPPTQLARLAATLQARATAEAIPETVRIRTTVAQPHRGAVARLLAADSGVRPRLEADAYKTAVRLHTGVRDGAGGDCPLCGEACETQGHHRRCAGMSVDNNVQHHRVRDAVAAWASSAPGARARTEHLVEPGVVADVLAVGPAASHLVWK